MCNRLLDVPVAMEVELKTANECDEMKEENSHMEGITIEENTDKIEVVTHNQEPLAAHILGNTILLIYYY